MRKRIRKTYLVELDCLTRNNFGVKLFERIMKRVIFSFNSLKKSYKATFKEIDKRKKDEV